MNPFVIVFTNVFWSLRAFFSKPRSEKSSLTKPITPKESSIEESEKSDKDVAQWVSSEPILKMIIRALILASRILGTRSSTILPYSHLALKPKTFSCFPNLRKASSVLDSDSPIKKVKSTKKRAKILDSDDDSQDSDHKYLFQ